jgi:hypothetical protein
VTAAERRLQLEIVIMECRQVDPKQDRAPSESPVNPAEASRHRRCHARAGRANEET